MGLTNPSPSGAAGGDLGGSYPNPTTPGRQRVLGSLRGANMNSTADQAIAILSTVTKFTVTAILVTNASTSLTLAAGGIYPAASKGGTALVAAGQLYSALTGATIILPATLVGTVAATLYTVSQLFLSLTTGQGSAATADVYVIGIDLT